MALKTNEWKTVCMLPLIGKVAKLVQVAVVSFPAMSDPEEPALLSLWFGFPSFLW